MSPESSGETLRNLENSIQIDGMLSQEEKNAFQEHFQIECGDIHAETSALISEFLSSDILANINQFDIVQQRTIRELIARNTQEQREFSSEESDLLNFFGIPEDIAQEVMVNLSPFNMDVFSKLESYKRYIQEQLYLPEGSHLSPGDYERILSCVTHSIGENVGNIPELVSSERERYSELSDREIVGIINDCIEEGFRDTKDIILPNAKLFLTSTAPGFFENSRDIFLQRGLDGGFRYEEIEMRTNIVQHQFESEISELGNCLISGDISSMPDVFNGWGNIGNDFEESLGMQNGLQEISNSCFLSEEDAQRYKTAKIRAAIFMVLQMLPTGVTDIASMGIDILDTFNNTDQSFETLKQLGVIDNDIHVGKAGWERILSAVGALGGIVSLDIATKGSRMMRVLRGSGITTPDILNEVDTFSHDLGLPEGVNSALKRSISGFGSNRANEAFMEIARANGRLSDAPGTDTFEIAGETLQVSTRERAFLERLLGAHQTGEIPFSIENLEPDQIRHLLDTLNQMHHMHGNTAIGEHRLSQIADKIRIARENGIPEYIARLAIREGFAGISFSLGERVIIPRSNGSNTIATIDGFPGNGKVHVTWDAGNGMIGEKTVDIDSIQRAGDISPDLLEGISQLDSGFLLVLNDGRIGYVTEKIGDTYTVEMTQVDGRIGNIQISQAQLIERSGDIADIVRYSPREISIPSFGNIDQAIMFIRNMNEPGIQGSAFYTKGYLLSILEDIQAGNLARIQEITSTGGLRTKVWGSIPDVVKREYIVPHLWPSGINSHLSQGSIGNCYFVAALRSIKSHPQAQEILSRIIKLEHDGSYTVRFPGDTHQREIRITSEQITEMQQAGGMSGSLGDMILERAYARLAREQQEGIVDGAYSGRTIIQPLNSGERGAMAIEGGWMIKTLNEIFGRFGINYDIPSEHIASFLNQINENNKSSVILSLSSRFPDGHTSGRVDNFRYTANDVNGNPINIFFGHAYGIENIDTINRRILIVNPHNTQNERFWMTYEQVTQHFGRLQGIGIDMNELGNWFNTADWLGDDVLMQAARN